MLLPLHGDIVTLVVKVYFQHKLPPFGSSHHLRHIATLEAASSSTWMPLVSGLNMATTTGTALHAAIAHHSVVKPRRG